MPNCKNCGQNTKNNVFCSRSCAASFNNGVIDLHQILFVKGVNNNLPMTRSYMYK